MNLLKTTLKRFFGRSKSRAGKSPAETSLDELQRILSCRFKNVSLLKQAVTHKSSINPDVASWLDSNERLEFFGDAVLNCLMTEHLYMTYPDKSEGELSKIKSLLVSRKILGDIAFEMEIGRFMILGVSERKAGGRRRRSVLSNTFEAILGALYLDAGMEQSRRFLGRFLFPRIDEFCNDEENVNYKSRILEMAQRDGFGIPQYTVISPSGPDHAKQFRVRIDIGGVAMGEGSGSNKKNAQQEAAFNATVKYDRDFILSNIQGA